MEIGSYMYDVHGSSATGLSMSRPLESNHLFLWCAKEIVVNIEIAIVKKKMKMNKLTYLST